MFFIYFKLRLLFTLRLGIVRTSSSSALGLQFILNSIFMKALKGFKNERLSKREMGNVAGGILYCRSVVNRNALYCFIVFFFFASAMRCFSQNNMPDRFVVVQFDCVMSGSAVYVDSSCVDTSYINLIYRHVFRTSEEKSSHPKDIPKQCFEHLYVGKNYTLYMGDKGRDDSPPEIVAGGLEEAIRLNNEVKARQQKEIERGVMYFITPFYMWVLRDNVSTVQKVAIADSWAAILEDPGLFSSPKGLANFYDEPFPELSWEITGDTAEVFGYDCIKAECDFRGRHWTAWFAPGIAVNEGPWKLRGLPGLILKADADGGWFTYECVGIDTEPRPIYRYHYDNERTMKYKRYMRYERRCFEDALFVLWDLLLPMVREDKLKAGLVGIPYYPMEYLKSKK